MFDISWSELLILAVVTLIFVGPKELPRFLNTLGRYAGVVRRHANEFRSVFEQAMKEAEIDQIQKEVRSMSEGVKTSFDDVTREVEAAKAATRVEPAIGKPAGETTPAEAAPAADAPAASDTANGPAEAASGTAAPKSTTEQA